jgi:hypothetical protein
VIDEVDIREESDLLFGESVLCAKEAAVEGRRGDAADSGEKAVPVASVRRAGPWWTNISRVPL